LASGGWHGDAAQEPLIWAFPPQPAWDECPGDAGFPLGPPGRRPMSGAAL